MKKFTEWLSTRDNELYANLVNPPEVASPPPKKVAHDPTEETGKKSGWEPPVLEYPNNSNKKKDELPKDTIWVQNMDQWTEKDRTAK
jgi:hypothetical protein